MECLRILLCSDFPSEEVASSSSLSTTELGENERETGRGFFLFCNTDKETLLFTTLFNRRAVRVFRNYYLMTNATKISNFSKEQQH